MTRKHSHGGLTREDRGGLIFPLDAYIEAFILAKEAANRSPKTIEFYRWGLEHFRWWTEHEGYEDSTCLDPRAIRLFLRYLQTETERWDSDWHPSRRTLTPASVHAYARALKAFCSWMAREGEIEDSPFRTVDMPSQPKRQPQPLTDDEIGALLDACARDPLYGRRDTAIILTLLDSGLRISELLSMTRRSIGRDGGISVTGKGRKERTVYVGESARQAVLRYVARRRDAWDQMWVGSQGPLGEEGIEKMLRRRSTQAGIRRVWPHLLRHTFAVCYLRAGGDVFTLMRLLGHTSIEMTRRYVALADTDVRDSHRRNSPVDRLFAK